MDPISIGASILAFVQVADRVIALCQHCIETIDNAPRDMQMILGETMSLRAIMDSLSDPRGSSNSLDLVPSLFDKTGPIEACRRSLTALEALLPKAFSAPQANQRLSRRITLTELAWPLKESKARRLLAELSHHKATLLLAITGDMIHDIKDIKTGVERLGDAMTDAQRLDVARWLETTNPSPLHNTAFQKHEPHTGSWFLRTPEWHSWREGSGSSRLMWIHGIPGSGKTVLASFIIETVSQLNANKTNVGNVYYYCHYSHSQNEAIPLLRWTVGQLLRQLGYVPDAIKRFYDQGCHPSIVNLKAALEILLLRLDVVYLMIDAIDESDPRGDLLETIKSLAVDGRFKKLRILATSRTYADIEEAFSGISVSISMANPHVEKDIRAFVHATLASSRPLRRWSHFFDQIENILVTKSHGMFRWAECQISSLERLQHESQIGATLDNLPKDLAETYLRIFQAIPEAERPFVRRVLIWIIGHGSAAWCTDRGISTEVLLSAVANEFGLATSTGRPHAHEVEHLRDMCGCLITITQIPLDLDHDGEQGFEGNNPDDADADADDEKGTENPFFVSLAHYTVREFLESTYLLQTPASFFALSPSTVASEMNKSVLRQALQANPEGTATNWVLDREAYCLTLTPSISPTDIEEEYMLLEYLNAGRPHFRRIYSIQERIMATSGVASTYFIQYLPYQVEVLKSSGDAVEEEQAIVSLGLLGTTFNEDLMKRVLVMGVKKSALEVKLSATWLDKANPGGKFTLQGTIREIVTQAGQFHPDIGVRDTVQFQFKNFL